MFDALRCQQTADDLRSFTPPLPFRFAKQRVYPGAGFLWSLAMAGGSSAPMEDDNLAVEVRRSAFEDLQRADLVMSHVTLPC